jgi:hypothetical protein
MRACLVSAMFHARTLKQDMAKISADLQQVMKDIDELKAEIESYPKQTIGEK